MTADDFNRQFEVRQETVSVPVPPDGVHDTDEARRFAARRSWEPIGFDRLYDDTVHEFAKELPESQRPELFRRVEQVFPRAEFEEFVIRLAAKYFTRRQLDAMSDFARTPEGASAMARGMSMTGPAVPSEGPGDSSIDRRVAAQRYMHVIGWKQLYGEIMATYAQRFPSIEKREEVYWQANRDYGESEKLLLESLERYRTRKEIDALARFYGTEDGRAFMKNFRFLVGEMIDYLEKALGRAGRRPG